jgi:hypothetical protein
MLRGRMALSALLVRVSERAAVPLAVVPKRDAWAMLFQRGEA